MINTILLPQIIKFGAHASNELPNILKILNCKSILIVTDDTMVELGYTEKLIQPFKNSQYKFSIFSDTVPEPTISSIYNGVKVAKDGNFDCIVALGGGSCIDSAKAIAILAIHGGKMQDYKFPHVTEKYGLPVIAVPTTAGTGSEATKATIITDEHNDEKMLCMGPAFMPKVALVDFCLSISVPPRTTADTGIDALTHAIKAFVSKKAKDII